MGYFEQAKSVWSENIPQAGRRIQEEYKDILEESRESARTYQKLWKGVGTSVLSLGIAFTSFTAIAGANECNQGSIGACVEDIAATGIVEAGTLGAALFFEKATKLGSTDLIKAEQEDLIEIELQGGESFFLGEIPAQL